METKEKAEKLIKMYQKVLRADNPCWLIEAKECALICVDQIIEELRIIVISTWAFRELKLYWDEVKQEIKKL